MSTQMTQRPYVTPRVDVFENKDELLLIADVPGTSEKDLAINLEENQLTIDAKSPGRPVDYQRTFVVPKGIDGGKIAAELKGGVLYLHLPKSDSVKPRRIEVKVG